MQCVERGTHQRQIKMSKLKCQVCILVIRVSPNIRVSPIILGISNYQGIFNYQDISNYQGISKNHNIFNYQGISNFNYKYSLSFYYMQNTMLNSNETHQCQEFEQESVRRTDFIKLPNYVIIYSDKKKYLETGQNMEERLGDSNKSALPWSLENPARKN